MMKINALHTSANQKTLFLLQQAVEEFEAERAAKTFSGRHPELGKMIQCPVCDRRHQSSHTCIPVYAASKTEEEFDGENWIPRILMASDKTRKGVYGASRFKRQRILKHRNARSLRILDRATQLFRTDYNPFYNDENVAGKMALSRAMNEIRKENKERRRKLLKITKASRKQNRYA